VLKVRFFTIASSNQTFNNLQVFGLHNMTVMHKITQKISVLQPFYTRGTLNIVEESWRHTNPNLHIWGGEMVYGIDWL
jgi:hypothetical protein